MQFSALSCHVFFKYFDRLTELSVMQITCCVSVLTAIDPLLGSLISLASAEGDGSHPALLSETTSCSPGSLGIKVCSCFATISSAYSL